MNTGKIEIKVVQNKEEFKIAYGIRIKVFVEEQKVPIEMELDEFDNSAIHIILYKDNKAIGCGRIIIQGKTARIGRIAILKEYRRNGYGKKICEKLISLAEENQMDEIVLHSQCYVTNFYKKIGFKKYGKNFEEAGIEHIEMRRKLN